MVVRCANSVNQERLSGAELSTMESAQESLNTQYQASVFTDFAFNGLGILDKVNSSGKRSSRQSYFDSNQFQVFRSKLPQNIYI